jgi:hypothetical protein
MAPTEGRRRCQLRTHLPAALPSTLPTLPAVYALDCTTADAAVLEFVRSAQSATSTNLRTNATEGQGRLSGQPKWRLDGHLDQVGL